MFDFYRPKAFAMDRTGLGLPIYSEIMNSAESSVEFQRSIRSYNFSEKIIVGYERREQDAPVDEDHPLGMPITANVLENFSDMLRVQGDGRGIVLPWDIDMLREFQGQTYVMSKSVTDAYGKAFQQGQVPRPRCGADGDSWLPAGAHRPARRDGAGQRADLRYPFSSDTSRAEFISLRQIL